MHRASLIIRSIWAACLLVATANHARILIQNGLFWDYGGVHWTSAVYWSSLTILDPIAAVLLFVRPKLGIVSTIALIVTNVVHNLSVRPSHVAEGAFFAWAAANPFILSQVGFMLFVAATAPIAWKGAARRLEAEPAPRR